MITMPPVSILEPGAIGQALVESDTFAVCALDGTLIRFASPALRGLFGLPPDAPLAGVSFETFVLASERARVRALLEAPDTLTVSVTFTALRADRSTVDLRLQGGRTRLGRRALLVAAVTDISGERRERESLSALAFVDPLTGLPNRALFLDRLREAIISAGREQRSFALFVGDLDGFKQVNDAFGHDAGDAVLRLAAARLRAVTRSADTLARLGGDELAAVLPSAGNEEAAAIVAGRMLRAISEPMTFDRQPLQVGMSLGIALFARDGADVDTLIGRADRAMYASKHAGKNRFTFVESAGATATATAGRHQFLSWTDAYTLGVPFMDSDHQRLATLVVDVGEQLKAGYDRDGLMASFDALMASTASHFAAEERHMEQQAYPGTTAHAQEHLRLLDDLRSLGQQIDALSMMLSMRYLSDWLLRHIDTVDRGLARWLRDREGGSPGSPTLAPPH
jgi:diguanylate cyclase (GGDEF)-like protein/hemerythrin-like metal-binding protein